MAESESKHNCSKTIKTVIFTIILVIILVFCCFNTLLSINNSSVNENNNKNVVNNTNFVRVTNKCGHCYCGEINVENMKAVMKEHNVSFIDNELLDVISKSSSTSFSKNSKVPRWEIVLVVLMIGNFVMVYVLFCKMKGEAHSEGSNGCS